MKLVEILSYNSVKNEYEHYTIVTSKSEKSLVTTDNNPTDKFYNFIIENIDSLKNRPKENTKVLVRDLSEYLKY